MVRSVPGPLRLRVWLELGVILLLCGGFIWSHLSILISFHYTVSMLGSNIANGEVALDVFISMKEAYNSGAVGLAVLIGVASVAFPYVKLAVLAWAVLDQRGGTARTAYTSNHIEANHSKVRCLWPASLSVVAALDVVNRFALLDVYVYVM